MNTRPAQAEPYRAKRFLGRLQYRWRVRAQNGNKLAMSSEGYNNSADMIDAMRSTRDALVTFFEGYDGLPTSKRKAKKA